MAVIRDIASHLPQRKLTNEDLATAYPDWSREPMCASDASAEAMACCQANADNLGVRCVGRVGDLFDCWANERFDLIVNDVSGVAEDVARNSQWFPQFAPCDSGPDGSRLTCRILNEAAGHMTPEGQIVFPVLSLSNEDFILETAHGNFQEVEKLGQQFYPFSSEIGISEGKISELMDRGYIRMTQIGGNWAWWTTIYRAAVPN